MSITKKQNEPLWVEAYRPATLEECIFPDRMKTHFESIIESGYIPNMLLSGTAGVGKTTIGKVLCNVLGVDWLFINISEESGIDTLRTKIRDFASTVSLSGNGKCVILDEFDHASANLQAGLRAFIEEFSSTCSFILTCNFPNRIIEPLHSRMTTNLEISINGSEKAEMQAKFYKRICDILKNEGIDYEPKVVATIINKMYPDNRRILNTLQDYSRGGVIDSGVLANLEEVSLDALVEAMKNKKFKDVRQWCAENASNDLSSMYTKLYRSMKDWLQQDSIPEVILVLDDYQRHDATVPDKELHIAAMCVQLMITAEFK